MADYTYWLNALKGEFGPIHDGEAQPGFYRKRTGKAAGYVPVAIWDADGKVVALVNGEGADPAELWSYVADKPITEAQYRSHVETGKWWDEDESVTASLAHDLNNQPDERAALADQIEAALAAVDTYKEVQTDEDAAKAQSARSRLLELSGDADKAREKLVRPHLDAQRDVNADWMPLVKNSKAGADTIKAAISAHETRQYNAAVKAAAEKAKRDAEEAAKHAPLDTVMDAPAPLSPPPVAPAPLRGSYGRGAARKLVKIAAVTDQDAAYAFLKAQPELAALILRLAQKMVDAGMTVPGVDVTEQVKVS